MAQSVFPNRNYPQYPTHTTDTRPSTSGLAVGYVGFNSISSKLEIWNGSAWKDMLGGVAAVKMPWADTAITFTGASSNVSGDDVASIGKGMANSTASTSAVQTGGTMTINGVSLGSYDFVIKNGNQTVSSFTNSDWFTTTADTRSAWVVVQGDMNIISGQTFIPTNRKLFTCIYVTGNLTVGGTISMSGRGASHSGTTAAAIRIATGTFSTISNPQVPAAGGAGVASSTNGNAGTGGGTGSGGGGQNDNAQSAPHGAAGTSFSGGAGGGGGRTHSGLTNVFGTAGAANGGAGGNAAPAGGPYPTANPSSGGSGNPAGSGGENPGGTGTGGVLFIIVEGTISGAGSITVNGVNPGSSSERPGGGSGGGSCTILAVTDSFGTPTATGGQGNGIYGATTNGGAGTARKLAIV
jgi:hypothetical protein